MYFFLFSKKWRIRLAQNATRIQTIDDLWKILKTINYSFNFSSLFYYCEVLVHSIISIVENALQPAIARLIIILDIKWQQ